MKPDKRTRRGTVVTTCDHLTGLLRKSRPRDTVAASWVRLIELLIAEHSTAPRKSGSYKGHSMTDAKSWIRELTHVTEQMIKRRNKGGYYDENLAMASSLGLALIAWYVHVHHAKALDPNRPLRARQSADRQRTQFLVELFAVIMDESVMGEVWGANQEWNFPYGKGAIGGSYV